MSSTTIKKKDKMRRNPKESPVDEVARLAKETFGSMKDLDFFSNRVTHLYFYGPVSRESVLALKDQIREANRREATPDQIESAKGKGQKTPLPIVVHVNSFGGSSHAMQTIFSAFLESKMPICAIVDGVSASASTMLSAGAPYRVVVPSSASLFHEWSMSFNVDDSIRKPDLEMVLEEMALHDKGYYGVIQNKIGRKMSKKELELLVKRDLFLSAKQCLQKGFADRILNFGRTKTAKDRITPNDVRSLLRDADATHVTVAPRKEEDEESDEDNVLNGLVDPVVLELDRVMQTNRSKVPALPIVIHFNQGYMEGIRRQMTHKFYGDTVPVLTRVRAAAALGTVVGVVDSIIDVVSAIPFLYCNVRAMYESAIFVIHVVYGRSDSAMFDDLIENTKGTLSELKRILTERTKLPKKIVEEMHRTRIVMNAKKCLEYGIVDVLI